MSSHTKNLFDLFVKNRTNSKSKKSFLLSENQSRAHNKGCGAGITLQYSRIKCRTQNIWSKEELCDMAGLLLHSEANERRPRCHFSGRSNDSQGILSAAGSLYLGTHWLTDRVTCAAYRIYQLIVSHTPPCHPHLVGGLIHPPQTASTCHVFGISMLCGRSAAQLRSYNAWTFDEWLLSYETY